ncbi:hypothetical protein BDN72DRAFT_897458 [Pluteus cervinus]|uniref:Uncharacterized protein n=1 Tax=Pluteus cervinus TaxID=181527 RepID=A0ACD3AU53_9AGAR|nr:hypothetical protein BDN72DRAFT_897458 [Pluteus cervinus]
MNCRAVITFSGCSLQITISRFTLPISLQPNSRQESLPYSPSPFLSATVDKSDACLPTYPTPTQLPTSTPRYSPHPGKSTNPLLSNRAALSLANDICDFYHHRHDERRTPASLIESVHFRHHQQWIPPDLTRAHLVIHPDHNWGTHVRRSRGEYLVAEGLKTGPWYRKATRICVNSHGTFQPLLIPLSCRSHKQISNSKSLLSRLINTSTPSKIQCQFQITTRMELIISLGYHCVVIDDWFSGIHIAGVGGGKKGLYPRKPGAGKVEPEKRAVVSFEERKFPALASMCIDLITEHIDDVEALGDTGTLNAQAISKALSRNRKLTSEHATLCYHVSNTFSTFHDTTAFAPAALSALARLNPNLAYLHL